MPTAFAAAFALLCFASPAVAADVARDARTAWSCQKAGKVVSYYSPFGRAPTMSEEAQCARLGGRIKDPTRSSRTATPRTPRRR